MYSLLEDICIMCMKHFSETYCDKLTKKRNTREKIIRATGYTFDYSEMMISK